jgi:PST family polysaccharide transporter/lipopolysaccharide exporter
MFLSYILIPGHPRLKFNRKIAWELFHYGKFITGVGIVLFIATEIDNVVVGKVLGMEALGYYYIAFMLANLPATHISKIASRVLFPAYSKLQNDPTALNEAYLRALGLIGSIAIPAAVGLLILAHEIITLVYGVKWQAAVGPLMILCVLGGVRAITSLNGYLMNGIGKPNVSFYIIVFRVVLIGILIYPMTLYYGLEGAAVAVTIPIIIQLIISMLSLKKLIGLKITSVLKVSGSILLRAMLMAAVLILLKLYLDPIDELELVLLVILGGGLYLVINRKQIFSFVKGNGI